MRGAVLPVLINVDVTVLEGETLITFVKRDAVATGLSGKRFCDNSHGTEEDLSAMLVGCGPLSRLKKRKTPEVSKRFAEANYFHFKL